MYTVSSTLSTAIANGTPQRVLLEFTKKPDGTAYSPVVQFSNEEVLVESGVEMDETFNSDTDLTIGKCPSAEIRFDVTLSGNGPSLYYSDNRICFERMHGRWMITEYGEHP